MALAADFRVRPDGDDGTGNGSDAAPWRTLRHAVGAVATGPHTIHLAAGTYLETSPIFLRAGLSVMGAGPEKTIIQNGYSVPNSSFDFLFRLDSSPDGTVEDGAQELAGFHLQGVNHAERTHQSGIRIRGRNNVTLRNLKISSMGNGGVDIRARDGIAGGPPEQPPSQFITGIVVTDCEFVDTARIAGRDSIGNLLIGGVDGGEFSYLTITESQGAGIRDWTGGWLRNVKIHHCRIDMMPAHRQQIASGDHSPAIQLQEVANECEVHHCVLNNWLVLTHSLPSASGPWNLRIHDNTFLSDHLFVDRPDGEPIRIGNHGTSDVEIAGNYFAGLTRSFAIWSAPEAGEVSHVAIHHNVFDADREDCHGITCQPKQGRDMSDLKIFNNTFFNIERAILVEPLNGLTARGVQIANNLCLDNRPPFTHLAARIEGKAENGVITDGFVRANYFYQVESDKGVRQSGSSTLDLMPATQIFRSPDGLAAEAFPLIASGSKPFPYFRLRPPGEGGPNSAIDAGTVIADFSGGVWGAPDIGAHEWFSDDPAWPDRLSIERAGTTITLRWSSVAGETYRIEATPDLFGSWSPIVDSVAADAAASETSHALPVAEGSAVKRFFRIRRNP